MKASQRSRNGGKKSTFYISAITVYYRAEAEDENSVGPQRQRTINVITNTDGPITKDDLHNINQEAFRRLHVENRVTQDRLLDVVVLNISPLGQMTRDEFLGSEAEQAALAEQPVAGNA